MLIPQMVQTLMGYTAEQAGEVLSPGAVVIILLLPLRWIMVGKSRRAAHDRERIGSRRSRCST